MPDENATASSVRSSCREADLEPAHGRVVESGVDRRRRRRGTGREGVERLDRRREVGDRVRARQVDGRRVDAERGEVVPAGVDGESVGLHGVSMRRSSGSGADLVEYDSERCPESASTAPIARSSPRCRTMRGSEQGARGARGDRALDVPRAGACAPRCAACCAASTPTSTARLLGRGLEAIVAVRVRPHSRPMVDAFWRVALSFPEVVQVFHVTGADDFLLHVAVSDTDGLRDFVLDRLTVRPEVGHVESRVVYDQARRPTLEPLVRVGRLPDPTGSAQPRRADGPVARRAPRRPRVRRRRLRRRGSGLGFGFGGAGGPTSTIAFSALVAPRVALVALAACRSGRPCACS